MENGIRLSTYKAQFESFQMHLNIKKTNNNRDKDIINCILFEIGDVLKMIKGSLKIAHNFNEYFV